MSSGKIPETTVRIPFFELTDSPDYDFNRQMKLISDRYQAEEKLLSAIAAGDENTAIAAYQSYGSLMQDPEQEERPTSSDSLRDFKNSMLVTNTLFRKAVENASVHPIYIHESSSYFGTAIEHAENMNQLYKLVRDMVHVYCRLVRECSLSGYSNTIKKALLFIDMHLASAISTRDIAKHQSLSPNYLSTRFKQEVGISISEYLIKRRISLACKLLSTTHFSVQHIAEKSGMGDASYFSKQFKRITGLSPLQYRKSMKERNKPPFLRPVVPASGHEKSASR